MSDNTLTCDDNNDLGEADLYFRTVPILNYDRGEPDIVGTGVFAAVDEKHFVLSAAHVFETGIGKVGFCFLNKQGKIEVFGSDRMKILAANPQSGAGNLNSVVYKDGLDLAVIEPTNEVLDALRTHYRAFDLRTSSYAPASRWGVVSGWPARKNIYHARKRVCDFDTCYHIQCPFVEADEVISAGWNADIHRSFG